MRPKGWAMLLAGMLLAGLPAPVAATCEPSECQGRVPMLDVPLVQGPDAIALERYEADVQALDGLATTRLLIELRNTGPGAAGANVTLQWPANGVMTGLDVVTDRQRLSAQVVAEDDVPPSQSGSARIAQATPRHVQLALEIPPGESFTVQATYVEWVLIAHGWHVYRLPTDQMGREPVVFRVTFQVEDRSGVEDLRFPGVPLGLVYHSPTVKTARVLQEGAGPVHAPTIAMWQPGDTEWRATLFLAPPEAGRTHQEAILTICSASQEHVGRAIAFVIDRSGSMAGTKMEQAREGLRAILLAVGFQDAYTVVAFDDRVEPFSTTMLQGHPQVVQADRYRLAFLEARGSTDLDGGLQEGLKQLAAQDAAQPDSGRVPLVVLLSDGLPSSGVTAPLQILDRAAKANVRQAAIHVVPIGLDADYTFLEDLAVTTGGTFTPMPANDTQAAQRLERLFETVARPMLYNMTLNVTGLESAGDTEPQPPNVDDCLRQRYLRPLVDPQPIVANFTGWDNQGFVNVSFDVNGALHVVDGVERLWGQEHIQQERAAVRKAGPSHGRLILTDAVRYQQLGPNATLALEAEGSGRITSTAPVPLPIDAPRPVPVPTNTTGNATGNGTDGGLGPGGNATGNQTDPAPSTPTKAERKSPAVMPPLFVAAMAAAAFARRRRQ